MLKIAIRIALWLSAAFLLSFLAAPNFLFVFNEALNSNVGSIFPVIPFAALLFVLFLLRGKDLVDLIAKETRSVKSEAKTRLIGVILIVSFFSLSRIFSNEPSYIGTVPTMLYIEGVAIILIVYGTSLVVNPLTKSLMLPYAIIYIGGVSAPALIQYALGEPLASFSAALSALFVNLSGIPITWHGTEFFLTTKTGDYIDAVITPGCSSVLSITTFLGLLGLICLDLKKDLRSTFKLAIIGIVVLTLLNSVRILILVWIGYTSGAAEFWSVHEWIGYALFLMFYFVTIPIYTRSGKFATDNIRPEFGAKLR